MMDLLVSGNADIHRPWRLVSAARERCEGKYSGCEGVHHRRISDRASFRTLIALEGEPPLNGRSLEGPGCLGAVNDSDVQFIYKMWLEARQLRIA